MIGCACVYFGVSLILVALRFGIDSGFDVGYEFWI